MNKKLKNNKNKLSDKEISEDFFEIFDHSDNFDLGNLFVEARAKHGLTQRSALNQKPVDPSSLSRIGSKAS